MAKNRQREKVRVTHLEIEDELMDGRGVARNCENKVQFVENALRGEIVDGHLERSKKDYEEISFVQCHRPSPHRVTPRCRVFGICGGCVWQHADPDYEILSKQRAVLEEMKRIGRVQPKQVVLPLVDQVWNYRRRSRLAVKWVAKKNRVLIGFREKGKPFLTDMDYCEILHIKIADRLPLLSELIFGLSIRERIPQIEASVGDNGTSLVFRVLDEPTAADRELLLQFAKQHQVQIYLQTGGPDTLAPLEPYPELYYYLQDDIRLEFGPLDFIQIHEQINAKMIEQALHWLDLRSSDRVLDLFCGLGNFSLPLARHVNTVVGVEGEDALVQKAKRNAEINRIENAEFICADLYSENTATQSQDLRWDVVMLDPPRSGAKEVLPAWLQGRPRAILYVSCHPGTLARDADFIVHDMGYELTRLGVMNMFPHTAHIETMALFTCKS